MLPSFPNEFSLPCPTNFLLMIRLNHVQTGSHGRANVEIFLYRRNRTSNSIDRHLCFSYRNVRMNVNRPSLIKIRPCPISLVTFHWINGILCMVDCAPFDRDSRHLERDTFDSEDNETTRDTGLVFGVTRHIGEHANSDVRRYGGDVWPLSRDNRVFAACLLRELKLARSPVNLACAIALVSSHTDKETSLSASNSGQTLGEIEAS